VVIAGPAAIRFCSMRLLSFSACLFLGITGFSQEPLKVVLAGDSTVASVLNPPKDRPDLAGWGQVLGEFLPKATVVNHARSGTSTKSFRDLGLWDRGPAASR
jgi:lysophospholipase L1-like esterase